MSIEHFEQEMDLYLSGCHPYEFGSFYTAILANDLVGAVGAADHMNKRLLGEYATFLYNNMPGRMNDPTRDYWGSYEAVKNRIAEQRRALADTPQDNTKGD